MAQAPASRLVSGSSGVVSISASKPLQSQATTDLGSAQVGARLERMLLLLEPSTAQQQALTAELQNQQNSASSEYHRWLTPAAFADSYANSSADVATVSAWLQSQGFQVASLPAGRGWIEFSGTVAQVEQAFQTQVDSDVTPTGTRFVLASDISVPATLQPLIHGIVSLDGALSAAALTTPQPVTTTAAKLAAETSPGSAEALTPQLVASLLHLDTLHSAGTKGTGETIAIATRSNVRTEDVTAFRTTFGLPASSLSIQPDGTDPGVTDDQAAATLAASWAGAAAPDAQILLVPAATTSATDGVDLALAAIVDQSLAHTVAVGYSICEGALSEAHQAFYAALYQQAAAEGISVIAATGDSGPSACHIEGSNLPVTSGYGVNALASTPWNTAVGVAAFGSTGPAAGITALSGWAPANSADSAYAGGGGSSTLFSAPSWQPISSKAVSAAVSSTTTAETASSHRLLPDVALPAAIDSTVNPGLAFCLSDSTTTSDCTLMRAGGSSAATAIFAGISALVAEKNGVQGNLASNLYTLSQSSGIFSDVQQGNAKLPCTADTSDCDSTEKIGYSAVSGYDQATGLGAVNAQALVTEWATAQVTGTESTTVTNTTTTGQTINPSGAVVLSATVASLTSGSAPTGTVAFYDQLTNSRLTTVSLASSTAVMSTASVTVTGILAQGSHPILAEYSGDTTYAAANSAAVTVTSQPSSTVTEVTPASSTAVSPGSSLVITSVVTAASAGSGASAPSGTVDFRLDGSSLGTGTLVAGTPATPSTNSTTSATITVPYVTAGSHLITGYYNSDTNYTSSTSSASTITVSASAPTVTVSLGTTTPQPGSSLTVTASITPLSSSGSSPTGTVTFYLGSTTESTISVVAGSTSTATTTITVPSSGTYTVKATYNGDNNYTETSATANFTVAKITPTLVLTSSNTAPNLGDSLVLTAKILNNYTGTTLPTGTITFLLDGTTQNTGTLASVSGVMTATLTITAPSSGAHTALATYGGDTYFATATSNAVTITTAKTSTTMVVSPSTTAPTVGDSLLSTATITPSTSTTLTTLPTGTVTFTFDGTTKTTGTVISASPATASGTFVIPSAGTHSLQATYGGDTNYATSTATAVTLTVAKAAPTVVVSPATLTPAASSSLVLTATITAPNTSVTAASGTVSFLLDGSQIGTGTVVSGSPSTATLTITTPAVGVHTVQAIYNGDTNYTSITTSTVSFTASKTTTSLAVTPASTTPVGGSSMQVTAVLTATLAGTTIPTGTVAFTMDGANVGSASVAGGTTASLAITVPAAGTGMHTLQATYSGDSNYLTSTSSAVTFTVAKTTTTTVVTPATTTPALGASLSVSATITPATVGSTLPSGTVTFSLDGVATGTVAITSGSPSTAGTTLSASVLTPGTHTLTATYSGDTYYATSTATSVTITVPKSPTTLAIIPATTTPAGGTALTITATLTATSPGTSLPTGTVTFSMDGTSIGTSAIVSGSPSTATVTMASTSVVPGTHVLTAVYSGDSYYATSTAASVTIDVTKGSTATTLTPSTLTPTAGGSMVVTASITSPNPVTTLPSGTVNITLDGVSQGTATVTTGSPSTATLTIALVNAGTHLLQAIYSGDTYYTGSTSTTVSIIAAKGASVTTVTAKPATLTADTTEALTATVAPQTSVTGTTYTLTGTVYFYDGTTLLGKVAVSSNTATLTSVSLAVNVNHTITAVYSGDSNWLTSTSSTLPLDASTLPDYVTLVSNHTILSPGLALVLTATVTPTTASTTEANPTGKVLFYNGTTLVGTAALIASTTDNTSTATFTSTTMSGGQDIFSAVYAGDSYYDMATSNSVTVTVQDFTITPSSTNPATNLTIVKGSSGSASFDITGIGGFNDKIQVVCSVPSTDYMTCTATPQQVVPPETVTFAVQTFTTGSSTTSANRKPQPFWPRAAGGTALALLGFFLLPFGKRIRRFVDRVGGKQARRFFVLLLLLVGLGSAGMGCNSTNITTTSASAGTPLGVATLKITANAYVDNAVVSRSVYLTVNVVSAD